MIYFLAGLKQGGWLSRTWQYTTDLSEARAFDRDEALSVARKHKANSNVLLLVRQEDIV